MGAKPHSYPRGRYHFHMVIVALLTYATNLLELHRQPVLEKLLFCALVVSASLGYHVMNSESIYLYIVKYIKSI